MNSSYLDELSDTVTCYVSFCEDMCVWTKTCTYNTNNPWFTEKLRQLRQAKEEAYRSRDRILYNQARNTQSCLFHPSPGVTQSDIKQPPTPPATSSPPSLTPHMHSVRWMCVSSFTDRRSERH